MPGASDFMVGNAPNAPNYAAPLIGMQLGDRIAQLPEQYFAGQQRARTTALQNAFPNGLPRDAKGNVDINGAMDTLTKLGGAEFAQQNIQLLMQGQLGAAGRQAIEGSADTSAPPQAAPAPSPSGGPGNSNAAGVAHIMGSRGTPAANPQPDLGDQNTGANTIRGIATETFGPNQDVSDRLPRYAAVLGVKVDDQLSPQQVKAARGLMAPRVAQAAPSNISDATGAGAPVTASSGTSGAPAPVGSAAPETSSPATGIVPSVPPTQSQQPMNVPGVPAGYDPTWYVNRLIQRATALRAQAAGMASFPAGAQQAKVLQEEAQAKDAQAKQILDFMGTAAQQTPEQKAARDPAVAAFNTAKAADVKGAEDDQAAFDKDYTGISNLGRNAALLQERIPIAKNLTLDPNFYSGPFHEGVESYNQFKSIFGAKPTAATPMEAFNKTTNDILADQIKAMGQSGVGRVLQAEVKIMQQGIASLGITPWSNRAQLEMLNRLYSAQQEYARIADQVKSNLKNSPPGQRQAALNQAITRYQQSHPLFTQQEVQHPLTLGAPDAPPESAQWSPQQKGAWAQGVGLKEGDPVRFNGQISAVPRYTVPLSPQNVQK
jgi:hypothetical protein